MGNEHWSKSNSLALALDKSLPAAIEKDKNKCRINQTGFHLPTNFGYKRAKLRCQRYQNFFNVLASQN